MVTDATSPHLPLEELLARRAGDLHFRIDVGVVAFPLPSHLVPPRRNEMADQFHRGKGCRRTDEMGSGIGAFQNLWVRFDESSRRRMAPFATRLRKGSMAALQRCWLPNLGIRPLVHRTAVPGAMVCVPRVALAEDKTA